MIEIVDRVCKDRDRPGCLGTPDERYTMLFDDIGELPIYWCAHCGPEAHAMNDVFMKALEDPVKRAQIEEAVVHEEKKAQSKRS